MSADRTLYVLRHAKSSWDEPSLRDHDRPLSDRGRAAITLISAYAAEHDIRPDLVLCSSATRAQQTLYGFDPALQPVIDSGLYGASAGEIITRLHAVDSENRSVMVVCHNPALQMLVLKLARNERAGRPVTAEGLTEIRHKLPTGALVTLTFPGEWTDLGAKRATLTDYVRPKVLK